MTIIVAFILEAFVFRMNFSRKNQDSEGLCQGQAPVLPAARLSVRPAAQLMCVVVFLVLSLLVSDRHTLSISFFKEKQYTSQFKENPTPEAGFWCIPPAVPCPLGCSLSPLSAAVSASNLHSEVLDPC